VHPVNELVNKLSQAVPLLLMGFNPLVTLSTAPVLTFFAIFIHANVNWDFGPLRYVIATPVFHRWHHSREREAWDKNFAGLLPLWDILFGTFYMPRGCYPENFGICEPMPKGFFGQLWEPFAWLMRRGKKVDPA
jgi:sterol desaturase/sphingolipid hydroxylase (fatty acid hydroxylase superfamily)